MQMHFCKSKKWNLNISSDSVGINGKYKHKYIYIDTDVLGKVSITISRKKWQQYDFLNAIIIVVEIYLKI